MSHSPSRAVTSAPKDIDDLFRPTHDERARQRFVSALRDHAKTTLRDRMQRSYKEKVEPRFVAEHGRAPESGAEIERIMEGDLEYQFYSVIRYNAQRMMWLSVLDPVERESERFNEYMKRIASERPAGGSLRLNPSLKIPHYATALDVHLIPGGFTAEYGEDDVTQGVLLAFGGRVSTGANVERAADTGGVGRSIAHWITRKYPDFAPRSMLDLGTQSGKNLLPYLDYFPDIEAHGVDVSAPALRYGHAKAEGLGKRIHFSQQNAEQLDFADGSFDLIVSSFFFHELPVKATRRILAECYRLLAPGGMMVHMELPPQSQCDPWLNFYWDWDVKHNNEPFYVDFRSQDLVELMTTAGFQPQSTFTIVLPNVVTFNMDNYPKFLSGELAAPLHGRGGWFVFGAKKA
jgi:ubiquinone/menaquinone biosynthesis C-methylase UbiE